MELFGNVSVGEDEEFMNHRNMLSCYAVNSRNMSTTVMGSLSDWCFLHYHVFLVFLKLTIKNQKLKFFLLICAEVSIVYKLMLDA